MSLKHTYTIFAPIYDRFVGGVFDTLRQSNLNELQRLPLSTSKILLSGIGTGLDLPLLPQGPEYVGMDLTPAMLDKARGRAKNLNIELRTGDVICPFAFEVSVFAKFLTSASIMLLTLNRYNDHR